MSRTLKRPPAPETRRMQKPFSFHLKMISIKVKILTQLFAGRLWDHYPSSRCQLRDPGCNFEFSAMTDGV